MEFPNLTKIFGEVIRIKVRSVTDSLFKFGLILFAFGIICAIFKTKEWLYIATFCMGGVMMFIGIGAYIYFIKKNPDYLRSEEYQLRKEGIIALGDKDNMLNPNIKNIPLITNPYLPEAIENKREDAQ